MIFFLMFLFLSTAHATNQNPEILDKDISTRFGTPKLAPLDKRQATIFISSSSMTQLDGFSVIAGEVTLAANAVAVVAPVAINALFFPIISEQNTSSKTVVCQAWTSSFTLTNTSGALSKSVNWWAFGRIR